MRAPGLRHHSAYAIVGPLPYSVEDDRDAELGRPRRQHPIVLGGFAIGDWVWWVDSFDVWCLAIIVEMPHRHGWVMLGYVPGYDEDWAREVVHAAWTTPIPLWRGGNADAAWPESWGQAAEAASRA